MIELYKLLQGNSSTLITSAPSDTSYAGETYISTPVKRTRIISKPDLLQNKVQLRLSVHTSLGLQLIRQVNNNLSNRLIIFRGDNSTYQQIWAGSLTEQSCNNEVAILTYGGGGVALRQLGDRRPFQRRCPFILYDPLTCRATEQFATCWVTAINPTNDVLLATGLGNYEVGYFTGGVLCPSENYSSDNIGNRFISSHNKTGTSDQLRLSTPVELSRGDRISVLAGCDRTWQICHSKFDNIINFGGFPYLPLANPYIAEVCSDDGVDEPVIESGSGDGNGDMNGDGNGNGNGNGNGVMDSCGNPGPTSLSGIYRLAIVYDVNPYFYSPDNPYLMGSTYDFAKRDAYFNILRSTIPTFWDRVKTACTAGGGRAYLSVTSYESKGPANISLSNRDYITGIEPNPFQDVLSRLNSELNGVRGSPSVPWETYWSLSFIGTNSLTYRIFDRMFMPLNAIGGLFGQDISVHNDRSRVRYTSALPGYFGSASRQATSRSIPEINLFGIIDNFPALADSDVEKVIIIGTTPVNTNVEGEIVNPTWLGPVTEDSSFRAAEQAAVERRPTWMFRSDTDRDTARHPNYAGLTRTGEADIADLIYVTAGDQESYRYALSSDMFTNTRAFASPYNVDIYTASYSPDNTNLGLSALSNVGHSCNLFGQGADALYNLAFGND